ncbi:MAG: hypothetical protein ABIR30_05705 [Chitinophagaceae bacterium]
MQTFCTIVTADHIPFAKALYSSLQQYHPGSGLQVLVVDGEPGNSHDQLVFLTLEDMSQNSFFSNIRQKYAHTNADIFRWALKPVLIGQLLEKGFSKVIFADPDLYFVNKFDFLFGLLDTYGILLTPHWADLDVIKSEDSVLSVLRNGLFNAGFVGASLAGLPAIQWWAGMCHYKMERRQDLGIYDDQKYLDILPVQFENVHILKHQGCNIASWNIHSCKREMIDGNLLINKKYEPVFIHFAKETIANILNRNDALLRPYLDQYSAVLQKEGVDLLKESDHAKFDSSMYSVKHKLRLRTRIKRFFFLLAEKL